MIGDRELIPFCYLASSKICEVKGKFRILVMGVSGSGKSTVAEALATKLGIPLLEGDDYHSQSNVDKMAAGIPLQDEDRWPWLKALHTAVSELPACVLACSALKESYREVLTDGDGIDTIIYLKGSADVIGARMAARKNHFMSTDLLQSQFDTLEEPTAAIMLNVEESVPVLVAAVTDLLYDNNSMKKHDIGLLGLGVMGRSLARNFASRDLDVSVYNVPFAGEENAVTDFVAAYPEAGFYGATDLQDFIASLQTPRVVFLMIKAGEAIDEMVEKLKPLLAKDDMIIDGGNSFFKDTRRRAIALEKESLHFVGVGVSGGEEGALKGPAIMPAGTSTAKERILPMLQKIAAVADGEPCVKWLGTDGAGHFVKMLHNGIEYGDMQLLAETYGICKHVLGYSNIETADLLQSWKSTSHNSYLLDITIDILRKQDTDGSSLLEQILDVAGHKGTGKWTSMEALELGVATPCMTAAMHQRVISSYKQIRTMAATRVAVDTIDLPKQVLHDGLLAARMINLAEGYHMMKVASDHYGWELQFADISQLWRGGCIIRSDMLPHFKAVYEQDGDLEHLIAAEAFVTVLRPLAGSLGELISLLGGTSVGTPCISASHNYYRSMTTAYLPINMIQAQRDYFGAHTYRRRDAPGQAVHTQWTD